MSGNYIPTKEQSAIIGHDGSAFCDRLSRCGEDADDGRAGQTSIVRRARSPWGSPSYRSQTRRLTNWRCGSGDLGFCRRRSSLASSALSTSSSGSFFVAPFGMEGCNVAPRLIPDKGDWNVQPHEKMQGLPLKAFDRETGKLNRAIAADEGFDANRDAMRHEALALRMLASARSKGHVDFEGRTRLREGAACRRGLRLAAGEGPCHPFQRDFRRRGTGLQSRRPRGSCSGFGSQGWSLR